MRQPGLFCAFFAGFFWAFFSIQTTSAQITPNHQQQFDSFIKASRLYSERQWKQARALLSELWIITESTSIESLHPNREDILYMLSMSQLALDEEVGMQYGQSFLNQYPGSLKTLLLCFEMGNYHFRHKDYASALSYYARTDISQLTNGQVAQLKYRQAYSFFQQGMYPQAKPLFQTIMQLPSDPHYADAHYFNGYIFYAEKKYADALNCFEKVKEHAHYGRIVPYYLSSLYYVQGNKGKAIATAEQAIRRGDLLEELSVRQLLGHLYYDQRDYQKAEPQLELFYKKSPKISRQQLFELSYCYFSNEKWLNAADGFKQLTDGTDSVSQYAMYLLGDIYLKTGQKESARSAFAFCSGNSSDLQQREASRFFYAKLSAELGYQGEAISSFKKFLEEYPKSKFQQEAKEILASLLGNTNNYKDALALLASLDKPSESTKKLMPRLLYGRAVEFINDQDYTKAEELLNQVLNDPYNKSILPYAQFWKGDLLFRKGELDKAAGFFEKFISASPDLQGQVGLQEGFYQLGYSYYGLKKFDDALNAFQKVIGKQSAQATTMQQDAFLRIADCYYLLRKRSLALESYQFILDRNWPASDYALYQKAILTGIGKSDQKIQLLDQLQKKYPSSTWSTEANMEIASTYLAGEQFQSAIPYLQRVTTLRTSALRPSALFQLGTTYYNLDKYDLSISTLQELLNDYPSSVHTTDALETMRTIYIETGKPQEYEQFLSSTGRTISALEADSLAYAAVMVKVEAAECPGLIKLANDYVTRFPTGLKIQKVVFERSRCYQAAKEWKKAFEGFELVSEGSPSSLSEVSALYGARIAYFELQQYENAQKLYERLYKLATTSEYKKESLRGNLRCLYKTRQFTIAQPIATELLNDKTIGNDDKALSYLMLGYHHLLTGNAEAATTSFRQTISLNKGEWAAEARYQIAKMQLDKKEWAQSEKSAFEVIQKSGSYELWVGKAYLLLGDNYFQQKDYFNAKATYQSISQNASLEEIRNEAATKLRQTIEAEKKDSKIQ